ncbi:hypothetical protein [Acidaminobacter sp. JC074]|uniref:hypothetical protein n=1 Tax=Acidaminobacter sp. JC074 TaxID=2530199 RepID=UPI001F0DED5E|nr:hypothetical protein [Acidaminobacter sp. JC074]
MDRIKAIKLELESMKLVNDCSYNNDGLYNEMRILREKLEKELEELLGEKNESEKSR